MPRSFRDLPCTLFTSGSAPKKKCKLVRQFHKAGLTLTLEPDLDSLLEEQAAPSLENRYNNPEQKTEQDKNVGLHGVKGWSNTGKPPLIKMSCSPIIDTADEGEVH